MSEIQRPEQRPDVPEIGAKSPEQLREVETRLQKRGAELDDAFPGMEASSKAEDADRHNAENSPKEANSNEQAWRKVELETSAINKAGQEISDKIENKNYHDLNSSQKDIGLNYDALDKISPQEYDDILRKSIHNVTSNTLTLGKFEPSIKEDGTRDYEHPSPNSYNMIAERNGDMYFDMRDGLYNETLEKYGLSCQEMFDYFNAPALDLAASQEKEIRFTVNPESNDRIGTFTEKEWAYLQEKWGYSYLLEDGGFYYAEK